jgi:hypothetical protein
MKMTKQSSKRLSFILFHNLFLTKFIIENVISTLVTGRINICSSNNILIIDGITYNEQSFSRILWKTTQIINQRWRHW